MHEQHRYRGGCIPISELDQNVGGIIQKDGEEWGGAQHLTRIAEHAGVGKGTLMGKGTLNTNRIPVLYVAEYLHDVSKSHMSANAESMHNAVTVF